MVFLHLVARNWEKFEFLGDWISFLGEGGLDHLLPWAINEKSCKLKKSGRQNYALCVYANYFNFTEEFFVWVCSFFSSAHWNSQKSVPYCLVIALSKCKYRLILELWLSQYCIVVTFWKCYYCVIWTLEKGFYNRLIWKELSENVSIAWYKFCNSVSIFCQ